MPICISCRHPILTLYTTYSKADDRALGKGVRLTQCPHCKRFADKYVEHDFVVLFIDLVLIKPEVYRHLLFNRLPPAASLSRAILRLGILLLLFDVYLTWARIEKLGSNAEILARNALGLQYLFFLTLVLASTLAFHIPIRLLCCVNTKYLQCLVPHFPHPNRISTALLVSSCTKLFPILLIIWNYDLRSAATAVSWAVIVNNVAALEILMDCGYVRAALLVGVGAGVRGTVEWGTLRAVGLGTGWEGFDARGEGRRWVEGVRSLL